MLYWLYLECSKFIIHHLNKPHDKHKTKEVTTIWVMTYALVILSAFGGINYRSDGRWYWHTSRPPWTVFTAVVWECVVYDQVMANASAAFCVCVKCKGTSFEIWGSYSCGYEVYCHLGCQTLCSLVEIYWYFIGLFDPKNGGSRFFWNSTKVLPGCMG